MKKIGLYMTAMMITAGVAMWEAPFLAHAEPMMVEASEIEEDIEDTETVLLSWIADWHSLRTICLGSIL